MYLNVNVISVMWFFNYFSSQNTDRKKLKYSSI